MTVTGSPGANCPPHAVDAVLAAYRDEGRRLAAAVSSVEVVERAWRAVWEIAA